MKRKRGAQHPAFARAQEYYHYDDLYKSGEARHYGNQKPVLRMVSRGFTISRSFRLLMCG